MGKSSLIPITIRRSRTGEHISEWRVKTSPVKGKGFGLPTRENLEQWRKDFNDSCKPGGANQHLGSNGMINYQIEIYNQRTKTILAVYNPPMFECID